MTDTLPEVIVHARGGGTAKRTPFGYTTAEHPRLDRIQNAISAACAAIAAIAIIGIAGLTVLEVISRTVADAPLGWNVGFVEQYLMMSVAFFGTVTAYRSGAHVAVVTVFEKMPVVARKIVLVLIYIVILIGLALLMYSGARAAAFSYSLGESPMPGTAELPLPTWWWKSIIPIAAGLGAVVVLIDLARELMAPLRTVATDYEPGDFPEGH